MSADTYDPNGEASKGVITYVGAFSVEPDKLKQLLENVNALYQGLSSGYRESMDIAYSMLNPDIQLLTADRFEALITRADIICNRMLGLYEVIELAVSEYIRADAIALEDQAGIYDRFRDLFEGQFFGIGQVGSAARMPDPAYFYALPPDVLEPITVKQEQTAAVNSTDLTPAQVLFDKRPKHAFAGAMGMFKAVTGLEASLINANQIGISNEIFVFGVMPGIWDDFLDNASSRFHETHQVTRDRLSKDGEAMLKSNKPYVPGSMAAVNASVAVVGLVAARKLLSQANVQVIKRGADDEDGVPVSQLKSNSGRTVRATNKFKALSEKGFVSAKTPSFLDIDDTRFIIDEDKWDVPLKDYIDVREMVRNPESSKFNTKIAPPPYLSERELEAFYSFKHMFVAGTPIAAALLKSVGSVLYGFDDEGLYLPRINQIEKRPKRNTTEIFSALVETSPATIVPPSFADIKNARIVIENNKRDIQSKGFIHVGEIAKNQDKGNIIFKPASRPYLSALKLETFYTFKHILVDSIPITAAALRGISAVLFGDIEGPPFKYMTVISKEVKDILKEFNVRVRVLPPEFGYMDRLLFERKKDKDIAASKPQNDKHIDAFEKGKTESGAGIPAAPNKKQTEELDGFIVNKGNASAPSKPTVLKDHELTQAAKKFLDNTIKLMVKAEVKELDGAFIEKLASTLKDFFVRYTPEKGLSKAGIDKSADELARSGHAGPDREILREVVKRADMDGAATLARDVRPQPEIERAVFVKDANVANVATAIPEGVKDITAITDAKGIAMLGTATSGAVVTSALSAVVDASDDYSKTFYRTYHKGVDLGKPTQKSDDKGSVREKKTSDTEELESSAFKSDNSVINIVTAKPTDDIDAYEKPLKDTAFNHLTREQVYSTLSAASGAVIGTGAFIGSLQVAKHLADSGVIKLPDGTVLGDYLRNAVDKAMDMLQHPSDLINAKTMSVISILVVDIAKDLAGAAKVSDIAFSGIAYAAVYLLTEFIENKS